MALDFAGNAYLNHTNTSALPSTSLSFSMCGGFQTDAAAANDWNALLGIAATATDYCLFEMGYTTSMSLLYFAGSESFDIRNEFFPTTGNNWYFVAAAVAGDAAGEQTYYWRTYAASTLTSGTAGDVSDVDFTPVDFRVGDSKIFPAEYWDGRVAHVRLWNVALTEAQFLTESKYDTLQYTTGALADYSMDVQGDYANDYNPGVGTLSLTGTAPTTATSPVLLSSGGVSISTIQHYRKFIGGM